MVFFRLRLVEKAIELFLPQKYDQLSMGVSGGRLYFQCASTLKYTSQSRATLHRVGQHFTESGNTTQSRTTLHRVGQHYTESGNTTQSRATLHRVGQHYTESGNTTQSRATLHRVGQHYTESGNTSQSRATLLRVGQHYTESSNTTQSRATLQVYMISSSHFKNSYFQVLNFVYKHEVFWLSYSMHTTSSMYPYRKKKKKQQPNTTNSL